MNYQRIYDFLINRAKLRGPLIGYYEKHHVVPRCLGGDNSKENIVKLTAKEHYIVHRLLVHIYPEEHKLVYAFWAMCNGSRKNRLVPSPRTYEQIKLKFSKLIKNRPGPNRGRKMSRKTKKKISKSKKGQQSWLGKTHTDLSKQKQSISAKSRKISRTTENKRRKNISKTLLNKPKSETHRKNISKAKLGKNNPMYGKKWKLVNGNRVYYT